MIPLQLRNGLYRHFKEGALYAVYDFTDAEATMKEEVSYIRLSDGKKFNRETCEWFDDVSQREDNGTGQKTRYKLMDTEITFFCNAEFESEPTLKEFIKANGILFDISLGDRILVSEPTYYVGEEPKLIPWTITGITDKGLYVIAGEENPFVHWKYIKGFVKNFK